MSISKLAGRGINLIVSPVELIGRVTNAGRHAVCIGRVLNTWI
jgi:hypothetical protein